MQRISVHITDETRERILLTAKARSQAESQVIREALEKGLHIIHPKARSAEALLNLARMAEQLPSEPNAPRDVSGNHDYYAWGEAKNGKK